MSPRLDNPKWLWYILAIFSGPWSPVGSVAVRTPPKVPATVEAQAKFFQDFFSVQLSPYKMEFGHVCEDPNTWEQRYEKKDFKNHRDMGKVRWGDKHGGYGEHYWDLNHAGHADKHGDDGNDGSYSVHDNEDPYDEPSEHENTYNDEYDPEQAAKYEETNRAKRRAHPKVKPEKISEGNDEEVKTLRKKTKDKNTNDPAKTEDLEETEEETAKYKPIKFHYKPREINYNEEPQAPTNLPSPAQNPTLQPSSHAENHYVPYEDGAGVRQHQQAQVAAASTPRLFLEPSTGHVVDRATGQAYVLQPILVNY